MENMDAIIEFVSELIKKGYAYASEGDVYFKTRAFEGYGKLSQQSIDELRSGARIRVGEKKEDALDFALGKPLRTEKFHGIALGEKAARAGILNAPQW